jgi:hypothetical protein
MANSSATEVPFSKLGRRQIDVRFEVLEGAPVATQQRRDPLVADLLHYQVMQHLLHGYI